MFIARILAASSTSEAALGSREGLPGHGGVADDEHWAAALEAGNLPLCERASAARPHARDLPAANSEKLVKDSHRPP